MPPIERLVPKGKVVGLAEVLGDDPVCQEYLRVINDLVSGAVLSIIPDKVKLAEETLTGFMKTPVQIFTLTTPETIYAYITLNGIEKAYLFVDSYANTPHCLEEVLDQQEIDALKRLAGVAVGQETFVEVK
jgi:hypothetical protein